MLRPEDIRQDMQRFIKNAARELLKPVESQILKRANNGHYNATVLVPMVYSRAVAEELAERVRSFGYTVTLQFLDEFEDYDHKIIISWEG